MATPPPRQTGDWPQAGAGAPRPLLLPRLLVAARDFALAQRRGPCRRAARSTSPVTTILDRLVRPGPEPGAHPRFSTSPVASPFAIVNVDLAHSRPSCLPEGLLHHDDGTGRPAPHRGTSINVLARADLDDGQVAGRHLHGAHVAGIGLPLRTSPADCARRSNRCGAWSGRRAPWGPPAMRKRRTAPANPRPIDTAVTSTYFDTLEKSHVQQGRRR